MNNRENIERNRGLLDKLYSTSFENVAALMGEIRARGFSIDMISYSRDYARASRPETNDRLDFSWNRNADGSLQIEEAEVFPLRIGGLQKIRR